MNSKNATTQDQILALRAALADNRLEVTIGDSMVKYKTNGDILKALEKLEGIAAVEVKGQSGRRSRAIAGSRFL